RPARAMSASPPPLKIPMPLRVPELAPSLARLLVPRRLEPPWVPLDDVREELATGVLELGGEARAAAVREERERVLDAVSRRAWLGAWERAVRRAGERVSAAVDAELEHAARRVRMPRLLRRGRLLSPSEQRAIPARLASGGPGIIAALHPLDPAAPPARAAPLLAQDPPAGVAGGAARALTAPRSPWARSGSVSISSKCPASRRSSPTRGRGCSSVSSLPLSAPIARAGPIPRPTWRCGSPRRKPSTRRSRGATWRVGSGGVRSKSSVRPTANPTCGSPASPPSGPARWA